MLAIDLLYITCTLFRYGLLIPDISKTFNMKGCRIFSNVFSASNEKIMCCFVFGFLYVVDYVAVFPYIELSLSPWDEAYLIVMNDHCDVFLNSVDKNFIE